MEEMQALEKCLTRTHKGVYLPHVLTETAHVSQPPWKFWKNSRWIIYYLI